MNDLRFPLRQLAKHPGYHGHSAGAGMTHGAGRDTVKGEESGYA